ncbi:acyl-CoA dehydrogenase family protein [Pseudonocardia sp. NPDC049154]|uniref:acyl-CoA dehydrogenase family protein n=1 Tax=Pseudonocardia sp. NPDC049154 TaxID=3155501 RepID=UPI0033D2AF0E
MSAATLVPTTAPDTEEEADLRATARDIARRCRDTAGEDHTACWAALHGAGFTQLREADEDGSPLATATMTAIVVEELAGAVCGAPLVGALLAGELARLGGVSPDAPATVLLAEDLAGLADDGAGLAWDAGAPLRHALALSGDGLLVVDLGEPTGTQDLSRFVARSSGAARRLGAAPSADALERFASFARLLLAADLLGTAGRVFADAVEYAKQRIQFGVPIGSFQSVQHLCGRAYAEVEALRSAVITAAWALDAGAEHRETSLVAKSYAARAGVEIVEHAVQVFGGVAITWEFPAHRHLRRALLDAEVFGGAEATADALLALVDQEATDGPE